MRRMPPLCTTPNSNASVVQCWSFIIQRTSLSCSPLGIVDTYVWRDVGAFLNFLISISAVNSITVLSVHWRLPLFLWIKDIHPKTNCMLVNTYGWNKQLGSLASSGFNEQWHYTGSFMKPWYSHVLGNVTYTEVVVNSAGLATLSAQT